MKLIDPAMLLSSAAIVAVTAMAAPPPPAGLAQTPIWTGYAENYSPNSALLGMAVGGGGDFNGDGYDDVVAGGPGSARALQPGAVVVFYGSAAGPHAHYDWLRYGPTEDEGYGTGVASAGDVNGDGYDDLIFTGSYTSHPLEVLVYLGSATGLGATPVRTYSFPNSDTTWPAPATSAGDVNGDGFADVIIGQRRYSSSAARQGKALVYHGGVNGPAAAPGWVATGAAANDNLGFSVASAGDVDGDGYSDVVVGTRTQARLYRGSSTGLRLTPSWTAPMQPVIGTYDTYGEVASAGDVNGDGYDDVLVGSPGAGAVATVALYFGSAAGLNPAPAWTLAENSGISGCSVDGAGDVNADGYGDFVVGGCDFDGAAHLFLGSASVPSQAPAWSIKGATGAFLGRAVRGAGDVNGDGRDDVIVGAPGYDIFVQGGRVYVFLGVLNDSIDLHMSRGSETTLTLSWDTSCDGAGKDWEVYAGTLGDFTSHTSILCSSNGEQAASVVPLSGDEYYLIVPRSVDSEGYYGAASVGMERPQGVPACLARMSSSCP